MPLEIDAVKKALSRNKGIVSRPARDLRIAEPPPIYELIHQSDLDIQDFKITAATVNKQIGQRRYPR